MTTTSAGPLAAYPALLYRDGRGVVVVSASKQQEVVCDDPAAWTPTGAVPDNGGGPVG